MTDLNDRTATAHHEAGHAVAAAVLGLELLEATIIADDDAAGAVMGIAADPLDVAARDDPDHARRVAVYLIAGMAAALAAGARPERVEAGGASDLLRAHR